MCRIIRLIWLTICDFLCGKLASFLSWDLLLARLVLMTLPLANLLDLFRLSDARSVVGTFNNVSGHQININVHPTPDVPTPRVDGLDRREFQPDCKAYYTFYMVYVENHSIKAAWCSQKQSPVISQEGAFSTNKQPEAS
ncbi:hypothetical protein SERLA73DRAFT_150319 [Serpula lacrymans var. lacrymans S7.3]|uniref:Uncharacterized protein n=1 Tax=Serpula lacrymans var. lacrymans (strain S7.3) TaxID=936435 RepID=F8PM21_SERL3|nr:hypothetical protein SERLA73DRAFT_150319 [Serpula lacrymans var. lacrymans S7.3]